MPTIDYSKLPARTFDIPGADGYPVVLDATTWKMPILRSRFMSDGVSFYYLDQSFAWTKGSVASRGGSRPLVFAGALEDGELAPETVIEPAAQLLYRMEVVAAYLGTVVPALQADG